MAKSHYQIRFEQTIAEMKAVYADKFKSIERYVEPKKEKAEFCDNLDMEWHTSSWCEFEILGGNLAINDFIKRSGLEKCKKSDATCLLVVGDKSETGCFIVGKYKNYWLKAGGQKNKNNLQDAD